LLIKVIIVEDSEDDLLLILRALKKGGFETVYTRVETKENLQSALGDDQWQVIISDHAMPCFSAPEALRILKESGRDLPFIIVSGTIGEDIAVESMHTGAHDYIMKGNLSRLAPAVERELRDAAIRAQHRRYQEELEYVTLHDSLTGLYNRLYFENELQRLEGGRSYPVSIISADLDGLNLINDTFGQKYGDQALKVCAELLKAPLRKGDVLARVGSDEFAAIIPRTDNIAVTGIVGLIGNEVDKYNRENQDLPISISIGFAVSKDESEPLDQTYRNANSVMLTDKQSRSKSARSQVVKVLMAALSERDYISGGHAERLRELCIKLGENIGLDGCRMAALSLVAQVHDLGKVGIPDSILFKEGGLSEEEWEIMRRHPEKGYRIAQSSQDLSHVADLILRHHEKWDGSGYPLGLKGLDIPVECRILSIVDAFDAMTNDRPYRKAKSEEEAVHELQCCAGTQFDPELVHRFLKII
jgi:diguanylate cyclase (GGDEF)-like protein